MLTATFHFRQSLTSLSTDDGAALLMRCFLGHIDSSDVLQAALLAAGLAVGMAAGVGPNTPTPQMGPVGITL